MSGRVLALAAFVSHEFDERCRQYFPRVFAYVYGRARDIQATEDLTSEVFRRAPAIDLTLRDEGAFAIWLFTTARHLLTPYSHRQRPLGSPPLQGAPEHDPLQPPDVTRILEGLGHFPLREQDVIALKFDAELTNTQIAQVMGLSEGNVRRILYRTLQKLRKALEREPQTRPACARWL